ncbi:AEC family transporter [Flaviflexus sp.]|uniref:AEC family transporter n=1 Tax=Flaviflexus sp. TaxID=1969482 RepID=UPI003F913EEB
MNNIVTAIVPIFLVVGVGYGFVRFGPFSRDDMPVLSRFVVKVALPLLIFLNIYGKPASDIFQVTYLLTYAGAVLIMFGIAFGYSAAKKRTPARRAFLGMGMSSTNNGFIGLPIFLILLPEWAGAAVGMDMLVDNTLTIPLTLFLAEQAIGTGTIRERLISTVRGVLLHPLVLAIIAALVLNAVGVVLPEFLHRSVDLIAGTSTGVALFTVGGMLVGLQIKGALADIFMIVGSKLLIMPTVAFGLLMSFIAIGLPDLPNELRAAAIITCALPPFSIMPSIAEPYGEADVTTAAMMLSILLSFFTLAGWTAVLGAIGWI